MQNQRFDAGYIAAAQDMPNGSQRVYVRLAKADHPYEYFNQDGTKRIERIKTNDLFSPASVSTASGMPTFLQHPAFKLDSSNNAGHVHGAVGENFVREDTSNGVFLGTTVTLFTDEAKAQSANSPGVSPGYAVQIERQDSGEFLQTSRIYDHLAIAVNPRGGADVKSLFDGVRFDAADDSDIWIARYDEDCYQCDANDEFIGRVLGYRSDRAELIQNTPIRLTAADLTPPIRHDDDVGGSCGCSKCAEKVAKKATRGKGFAPDEDEEAPPTKKKKRMSTTTFKLDGVDWDEIPSPFAQAVQVRLDRMDAVSNKNESMQSKIADLETENEALREIVAEMEAAAKGRTDADNSDRADAPTEEEFLEAVIAAADTIDRMRADGRALVAAGKIKTFNEDGAYICQNMGELQRDMIVFAAPSMSDRIDSYDDAQVSAMYEAVMSSVQHTQEPVNRADSSARGSSLRILGSTLRHDSAKSSSHWKDRKKAEYDEEMKAHTEAYNSVGKK
jgi:hypothetical protein